MRNIFKYIPMVTLGQILGTVVAFPLLIFLINIFYFSNKYNDVTELNADAYIKRSVIRNYYARLRFWKVYWEAFGWASLVCVKCSK